MKRSRNIGKEGKIKGKNEKRWAPQERKGEKTKKGKYPKAELEVVPS